MTQICPKCNYVRKLTDEAPDWQCPSCQVVYAKVGASAAADTRRPRPIPINAPSSGYFKWIVIAVLLGAGFWIIKPAHHKSTSAISTASANQPTVILYGTTWCGVCAAAREYFAKNGIEYTYMDIESSTQAYEEHKKLGGNGVPYIVVGDEVVHGFSEWHMKELLEPWFK
jgi:glutaredoxin